MNEMKRRWFQFSLRTAIVMMVVAAVGIGVYIRWPYYRAAKMLDEASGDKTFPAWSIVRDALVQNQDFRESASKNSSFPVQIGYERDLSAESRVAVYIFLKRAKWLVTVVNDKGWKVQFIDSD